jgi:hypothetical protein
MGYLLNFKNNLDIEFTLRPTPEATLVWGLGEGVLGLGGPRIFQFMLLKGGCA